MYKVYLGLYNPSVCKKVSKIIVSVCANHDNDINASIDPEPNIFYFIWSFFEILIINLKIAEISSFFRFSSDLFDRVSII